MTSLPSSQVPTLDASLRALLEAQPEATFDRLLAKRGVELDPHKQLAAAEQAARQLALLPRRLVEALAPASQQALDALVPAPGHQPRAVLGGGALPLVELGLVFAHPELPGELVLPGAYRLQLARSRAEHHQSARALLARVDDETRDDLVLTHHRRRLTVAWPLALERVLLRLESEHEIESLLTMIDRTGLLVLAAIEARGSDVSVDAYLELCREPGRWTGSRVPRRGLAHQLITLGLVLPGNEGRVVMPHEVACVVGRERREALERSRRAAVETTESREDEPARALLGAPPGPRALAAWLDALGDEGALDPRPPGRARIARAARRASLSFDAVLLLVTLTRAAPTRSHTLASLGYALFDAWRNGTAWDELREDPRAAPSADEPDTPVHLLRACILDALEALPRGRFASRDDVRRAVASDLRFDGVKSSFDRDRARRNLGWVGTLDEGVERILDVSLPALGAVDVGHDGSIRLAAWTTRTFERATTTSTPTWHEDDRVRLDGAQPLAPLVVLASLAPCVDAVADGSTLVCTLLPEAVPIDARTRFLDIVATLGCPNREALASRVPAPRAEGSLLAASFALTLPSAALARELETDAELAAWVLPVPADAPLVLFREDVPRARLAQRLERVGIVVRSPTLPPPPGRRVSRRPR